MIDDHDTWMQWNQRQLLRAVARVHQALARHAEQVLRRPVPALPDVPPEEGPAPDAPAALARVRDAFGLSPFEHDLLILCAAVELDATVASLCAALHGDERRACPTFGLALAALPDGHWSALTPTAPLRRFHLVEVQDGDRLTASPLRISERVLHLLTGLSCPEGRLAGLVLPVPPPEALSASHQALAERIAALWAGPAHPAVPPRGGPPGFAEGRSAAEPPLIELSGPATTARPAIAAAACEALGMGLHQVRAGDLPAAHGEREALCRLWEREAILHRGALLLCVEDGDGPEEQRRAAAVAERLSCPLLLSTSRPLRGVRRPGLVRLEVDWPEAAEQQALWRALLGPGAAALNGQIERISTQFQLGGGEIRAALSQAGAKEDPAFATGLWDACRAQVRHQLDELAERIEPRAGWDDLVLPAPQLQTLREIGLHQRHQARVGGAFSRGGRGRRGLGTSALFGGPSGTGKTLGAEVLAGALRLDLYRIDLSQVVSKYIGETEKNLRRVFDAAEGGGVVLLFDEADALFGKRSEVRDSHDRYANIEISYLLQRMESYRGLAILTTNLPDALDGAFLRRLRFIVHFPFPDPAQREALWRRAFPSAVPTEGLDPARLATLNVSGGHIRNIALGAAYLAAEAEEPVRMRHLLTAARSEYVKLGRPLPEAEIRGWV